MSLQGYGGKTKERKKITSRVWEILEILTYFKRGSLGRKGREQKNEIRLIFPLVL